MRSIKLPASRHARRRMSQRNINGEDVAMVLHFGCTEYRAGAEFCFLGAWDIAIGCYLFPRVSR